MEFKATLQLNGKTATGIEVPAEVIDALDGGKRPPVSVTIDTFTFQTTVGVNGRLVLDPGQRRTPRWGGHRCG